MTCVVNDNNALFGYLLLKEELNKSEVQDLLSVSKYSDLNLFPAGLISYKDHPLHQYICEGNVFHATLGDEKLVEQEPDNIILKTPSLVFNPVTVNNFASLFNCTPVGRASDSMMAPT